MSGLLREIFDQLSGMAVLREKVTMTAERVAKMSDLVIDHERRLTRLETLAGAGARATPTARKRPPKKT
jgi:hypothetical protein